MTDPNEAVTRKQMIDPALARAGWDVNNPDQVGIEVSIKSLDAQARLAHETAMKRIAEADGRYDVQSQGECDYVLNRPNGEIADIVREFKRFRVQQREAERQAEHLFQSLLHRAFRGEV